MNDSGGWLRDWATWLVIVVTLAVAMILIGAARIGSWRVDGLPGGTSLHVQVLAAFLGRERTGDRSARDLIP